MRGKKIECSVGLVISIFCIVLISGCAGVKIRASDSMFQENNIKRIAILGEGRLEWPRIGGKEPVLGLPDTKIALEILVTKAKEVLSRKGYEIVFSEPVGVGYYNPLYKENWVYENYGEKREESKKWQITDKRPAYEYPAVQNNPEFAKTVQSLFEQIELAIYQRRLNTFVPSQNDLEVVRQVTGADTICFNRIYGQKFSTGRKVTAALVAGVTLQDTLESFFIFADARTGEVLWQNGTYLAGVDPVTFGTKYIPVIFNYFPERNRSIEAKCKKKNVEGPIYECKQ